MTLPENNEPVQPSVPAAPAAPAAPEFAAAGYPQAPGYAPAPAYGAPAPVPGKTLGIVGFVLAFLGPLSVAGLVISIVALVQSKKAGAKNGFALAGIIISAVVIVIGIISTIAVIALSGYAFSELCSGYASGDVLDVNGQLVTCP